jgi:hypothetical protein
MEARIFRISNFHTSSSPGRDQKEISAIFEPTSISYLALIWSVLLDS